MSGGTLGLFFLLFDNYREQTDLFFIVRTLCNENYSDRRCCYQQQLSICTDVWRKDISWEHGKRFGCLVTKNTSGVLVYPPSAHT